MGGFLEGLDKLIDMVFKDKYPDLLMPVPIPVIAGFLDIDKPGSAILFFQVEKICPLSAGYFFTVNFFSRNGSHLH